MLTSVLTALVKDSKKEIIDKFYVQIVTLNKGSQATHFTFFFKKATHFIVNPGVSPNVNVSVPDFNFIVDTNNEDFPPKIQEGLKLITAHMGDTVKPTLSKADVLSSTSLTTEKN